MVTLFCRTSGLKMAPSSTSRCTGCVSQRSICGGRRLTERQTVSRDVGRLHRTGGAEGMSNTYNHGHGHHHEPHHGHDYDHHHKLPVSFDEVRTMAIESLLIEK